MNKEFKLDERPEDIRVNEKCEVLIKNQAATFRAKWEQNQLDEIVSRSKSFCEFCGYDLITEKQLVKHKLEHKLGLPMCPICPLKPFFKTRSAYLAHLKLHDSLENLHECDFCCTNLYMSHRRKHIQAHKTLKLRRCYKTRNCH